MHKNFCAFVGDLLLIIEMHGELIFKFVNAKQAKLVHQYRNIKKKLLKSNAAIWFNKVCRSEQLTPSYIDIKVNGDNERSRKTKNAATKHRINTELKHLEVLWKTSNV
jgi:hypothetical protein